MGTYKVNRKLRFYAPLDDRDVYIYTCRCNVDNSDDDFIVGMLQSVTSAMWYI